MKRPFRTASRNVREGREVIPGLAGREWIEEKKVEWGEDSALYKIRVRGEFVLQEDGKILTVHAIGEAEARWHEARGNGRLCIGLDPAGPGQGGDETVFAVRRGDKVLSLIALRGVSEDSHLAHLLGILKEHRGPREPLPLVLVDREGPIGSRLFGLLRAHADRNLDSFEVVGVRSSDRAAREPQIYDRVRDELWANLAHWLREGGAIPEDVRLANGHHRAVALLTAGHNRAPVLVCTVSNVGATPMVRAGMFNPPTVIEQAPRSPMVVPPTTFFASSRGGGAMRVPSFDKPREDLIESSLFVMKRGARPQ